MKMFRRAAVLGAGTMGSRIAAQLANAGVPSLLLDLSKEGKDRSETARKGLETALKSRPEAFFSPDLAALVTPGNFDDDLSRLGECDWIIEAVTENLAIKRSLWEKVAAVRAPGAVLSTNTSGIPLARLAEGFPEDFQSHFLGTHFFNPPRYLHLVEVIPGPGTSEALLEAVAEFCDLRLGKGVVRAKDTPNFIANRLGAFFGSTVLRLMVEDNYTLEEVEALTGPLIGLPKSASFRLLDIVGLDVWNFVSRNLYELAPHDRWRERFLPPPFLEQMIARGWLGQKSGQGFYQRVGPEKEIHAIDWKTLEYHPAAKPRFGSVDSARVIPGLGERLGVLLRGNDRAGQFLWKLFRDYFLYAAERIPEIADRVVEADRAMRWGYNHEMGPFELWDALGVADTVQRMRAERCEIPPAVEALLASGARSFYRSADSGGEPRTEYFDLGARTRRELEPQPGVLRLADLKRARGVVERNEGASLVDLGDGVACVEFHSKMNTLGQDQIAMIGRALDRLATDFDALVIGNQGEHFSAGANLMLLLLVAQEGEWDELAATIHRFQQAMLALKYAPKPVVAAPFGMTLAGGAEVALHACRMQASAELYIGLVETGVGLIPAGGGCKEMLLRVGDPRRLLETVGYAKVSTSAEHARRLGFLTPADMVSMNPERLLGDAKSLALALARDYRPGTPRTDIPVGGETAYASLKLGLWMARQGNFISDYDLAIGEKLALVLAGGRLTGSHTVSEQYLLDLEREAFLSLLGQPKTQERIQHMLKTGKPLRN